MKAKPPVTVDIRAFPWPPPDASTRTPVPRDLLTAAGAQTTLGQVADRLEKAFDQCGYGEKGWYNVPEGFALASRLEQINPDGTSKPENERWIAKGCTPPIHSLKDYIRALFIAQKGRFRLLVFIVTSEPFKESEQGPTPEQAKQWTDAGATVLPAAIKKRPFTQEHYCTALIYEFIQKTTDQLAELVDPSLISGTEHLKRARLMAALEGSP